MITPIYKSGQKLDLCNYRPISLLSVLSKLFEKIIHDQVSMFMKENGLSSNCQHGFRQLHSTVTSLISLTDLWFSNIDRKKVNISVFLDLKKAFDTVDHDLLMGGSSKLAACGITGGGGGSSVVLILLKEERTLLPDYWRKIESSGYTVWDTSGFMPWAPFIHYLCK